MESELPHLVFIDDDVLSTGITLYHLKVPLLRDGSSLRSRMVKSCNLTIILFFCCRMERLTLAETTQALVKILVS